MEHPEVKKGKRMIRLELKPNQPHLIEETQAVISNGSLTLNRIIPSMNISGMENKPSLSFQDEMQLTPKVGRQEESKNNFVLAWIAEADSLGQGNYFLHFMSEDEIGQYEMLNSIEYNLEKVFGKAEEKQQIHKVAQDQHRRKTIHKSIMAKNGRQNALINFLAVMSNDEKWRKETASVIARKDKLTLISRSEIQRQAQSQFQIICCAIILLTYVVDFIIFVEKSNAILAQSKLNEMFGNKLILSRLTYLIVRIHKAAKAGVGPLVIFYQQAVK